MTGRLIILVSGLALLGTAACAQQARSGPELLAAAEQSFSDIPFGTREGAPGLTMVIEGQCQEWGECSYIDANQIEHAFWEGELVVKAFGFEEGDDLPTRVLGIGVARDMDDVIAKVGQLLPEAKINCERTPQGDYYCGATLGGGWIKLLFDSNGRITLARIDAYHFT